jgi:hypothetical protein
MTDQEAQDLVDERAKELSTVLHCSCGKIALSLFGWRYNESCSEWVNSHIICHHNLLSDCKRE